MCIRTLAAIGTLALGLSGPAVAQQPPSPGAVKQKQLRQQKQGELLERFLALPPAQRQRLLQQLAPERRRLLQQRLSALELLSESEREALRGRMQRFADLPLERRQAVRQELQYLRSLKPEDRRRRMAAEDFRRNFSPQELDLLFDVTGEPRP
jgi:hypothetical protein